MYVNSKTQKAGSHSKRQGKAISNKVGKRRKLMNSIHKLDLMLQEEFTSFNNLANSHEPEQRQIDDLMRTVDHTSERFKRFAISAAVHAGFVRRNRSADR